MAGPGQGILLRMTDHPNTTADDHSAAGNPPEAGGMPTPAEAVAPDVEVSEVGAADAAPADADPSAGTDGAAAAPDFNADAAAPEPSD